ncbi:MAG TPA: hypothetical protein VLF60_02150 [Candidatus Saccharimonadales bacterium]|nr:hypothetical protein [Candidatus Saccharimonadales bacterium]
MNKMMKISIAVVVVAVIAAAAVLVMHKKDNDKDASSAAPTSSSSSTHTGSNGNTSANGSSSTTPSSSGASTAAAVTISYLGDGFELSATSVKVNSVIKVTNTSDKQLDFDSDPHPIHTDEPEFNLGSIGPGESKTFTVTKKGTWGFHNHLNSSQHAKITVD